MTRFALFDRGGVSGFNPVGPSPSAVFTVALLTLAAGGCDLDRPTAPLSPPPEQRAEREAPATTPGIPWVAAVDLDLEIEGPFKPGLPVTVRAQSTLLRRVENLDVTIQAPEYAVSLQKGWDWRSLPVREPIPSVAAAPRAAGNPGESRTATATLTFESPGLYSVRGRAVGDGPPISEEGRFIVWSAHATKWVLITERGGMVVDSFDVSLLPAGTLNMPGPFRPATEPAPEGGRGGILGATYQAVYLNEDTDEYDPVAGVYWQGYPFEGYTNTNGYFTVPCEVDSASVSLTDHDVVSVADNYYYVDNQSCVGHQVVLTSETAHVFTHIRASASAAESFFGASRDLVPVYVWQNIDNSYYNRWEDKIFIKRNGQVWGPWGGFTAAHEYGHAFHEEALGGIEGGGCPDPHYLSQESSIGCAYSEGFADYFAVKTLASTYAYSTEADGWYSNGDNGAEVEGAVASFLWDLTDSGVEAHDSVAWPGTYLRGLFQTCEADGDRADGIDQFIYCTEQNIDYSLPQWFGRSAPGGYSENASEPGTWSRDAVRKGFMMNLYDEDWPFFTVSISGPASVDTTGTYQWTASPQNASPPYTYTWYRKTDHWWPRGSATCHYETDWQVVGYNATYSAGVSPSALDFTLQVVVTSGGETAGQSIHVLAGDGSQQCPY